MSGVTGKGIADLAQLDAESYGAAHTTDYTKFAFTCCQAQGEMVARVQGSGHGAIVTAAVR